MPALNGLVLTVVQGTVAPGRIYWYICARASYPHAVPRIAGSQSAFNRAAANALGDIGKSRHQVGDLLARPIVKPVTDHLLCDGSQVGRTAYPQLFAEIGVSWGSGDGSTTFNVPNLLTSVLPLATSAPAQIIQPTSGTVSTGETIIAPTAPGETGGTVGGNYSSGGIVRPAQP